MRILFVSMCVCFLAGVLLLVADCLQLSAGPAEIGSWGVQAIRGDAVFYHNHVIVWTTPLASLAVPLALPLVAWVVLAARRSARRHGFPVDVN